MVPDAEILRIAVEVFEGLGWKGRYSIKVNHRQILDGMFAVCGVPQDKIRTISSAVDKLDKSPWEEVKKEMVDEKGLPKEVADKIWSFVQKKGGRDVLQYLQSEESLKSNESMTKGLADMELLFTYLDAFGITDKVEFNLSLARGLDYYTGVIYEVVTEGSAPPASSADPTAIAPPKPSGKKSKSKAKEEDEDRSDDPTIGVGSVAAGGRYDGLVGMFSGKNQIPCVGISFGVDRIFSVTKARMEADKAVQAVRSTEVDVYVMAFGFGKTFSGFLTERMEVCRTLWEAGIKVRHLLPLDWFLSFHFLWPPILHYVPFPYLQFYAPPPLSPSSLSFEAAIKRLLISPPGRILLQTQTQAPRAVQARRSRRRALCRHPRRGRASAREGQDQGDGLAGRTPGEGRRAGRSEGSCFGGQGEVEEEGGGRGRGDGRGAGSSR